MIQPVALQDFFITFFSAAAVIVFGAGYAALFAFARLGRRRRLLPWAYVCYGLLAGAVFLLADAAHLTGAWMSLTVLMLAGYLAAPHAIWRLCDATHRSEHDDLAARGGDPRGR